MFEFWPDLCLKFRFTCNLPLYSMVSPIINAGSQVSDCCPLGCLFVFCPALVIVMYFFVVMISLRKNIIIHHGCESEIENSVPFVITTCHHSA